MAMRLYDLSQQYNDLIDMLEDDTDNAVLIGYLEGIDEVFDSKVESIVKLMRSKIADHTSVKAEAERLNARVSKMAKSIEWLEGYVESQMLATGKDEVKSLLFDIKLAKCPPAVSVTNLGLIPQEYFTQPVAPPPALDKRKLLEVMKAGTVVDGAEIQQRKTLRIK